MSEPTTRFEADFAVLDIAPAASAQMIAWYAPKTLAVLAQYLAVRAEAGIDDTPSVAARQEVLAEMAAEADGEVNR